MRKSPIGLAACLAALAVLLAVAGLVVTAAHPNPRPRPLQTLLDVSGGGDRATPVFTLPMGLGRWDVWYAFGLDAPGRWDPAGRIRFDIADKPVGLAAPNIPPSTLFAFAPPSGSDPGSWIPGGTGADFGPHRLVITSETVSDNGRHVPAGRWHVKVIWTPKDGA